MKKLLIIFILSISVTTYAQIDWSNYATSVEERGDTPSLAIAIPYNGIYDNFLRNVVGISHWNPRYNLNLDTALNADIPLYFVYDTAGVYFLLGKVNAANARNFELTVLIDNRVEVTPWSHVTQFTSTAVGNMPAGCAITGKYRAGIDHYLVAHLRNNQGQIISSRVVYFKSARPEIARLSTADNASEFSPLLTDQDHFQSVETDIGWHRQYSGNLGTGKVLDLSYSEDNVLIEISSKIYKKEALEYLLIRDDKEIRKWGSNEYDNNIILLKNLKPGHYTLRLRFRRQPTSVSELQFVVSSVWYKTSAFKAAVSVLLIFLAACLLLLLKYRKQKLAFIRVQKNEQQSAEALHKIHALLNPHFTFNALNSIQGLVNRGDADAASKYLSSFGELLRESLKEDVTDHIPLAKELKNLEMYIALEQLRYRFKYKLSVDQSIDVQSVTVPPFLFQPFVENSIKHGLAKMDGRGELILAIGKDVDTLVVNILDNGPGLQQSPIKEGYGLSLSRKRIALLNSRYREELIRLSFKSTAAGASILLTFKNWF